MGMAQIDIVEFLADNAEKGEYAQAEVDSIGLDLYPADGGSNPVIGWSILFFDDEREAEAAFEHYNSPWGIADLLRYMEYEASPEEVDTARLTFGICEVCGDSYDEQPTDLQSEWALQENGEWL